MSYKNNKIAITTTNKTPNYNNMENHNNNNIKKKNKKNNNKINNNNIDKNRIKSSNINNENPEILKGQLIGARPSKQTLNSNQNRKTKKNSENKTNSKTDNDSKKNNDNRNSRRKKGGNQKKKGKKKGKNSSDGPYNSDVSLLDRMTSGGFRMSRSSRDSDSSTERSEMTCGSFYLRFMQARCCCFGSCCNSCLGGCCCGCCPKRNTCGHNVNAFNDEYPDSDKESERLDHSIESCHSDIGVTDAELHRNNNNKIVRIKNKNNCNRSCKNKNKKCKNKNKKCKNKTKKSPNNKFSLNNKTSSNNRSCLTKKKRSINQNNVKTRFYTKQNKTNNQNFNSPEKDSLPTSTSRAKCFGIKSYRKSFHDRSRLLECFEEKSQGPRRGSRRGESIPQRGMGTTCSSHSDHFDPQTQSHQPAYFVPGSQTSAFETFPHGDNFRTPMQTTNATMDSSIFDSHFYYLPPANNQFSFFPNSMPEASGFPEQYFSYYSSYDENLDASANHVGSGSPPQMDHHLSKPLNVSNHAQLSQQYPQSSRSSNIIDPPPYSRLQMLSEDGICVTNCEKQGTTWKKIPNKHSAADVDTRRFESQNDGEIDARSTMDWEKELQRGVGKEIGKGDNNPEKEIEKKVQKEVKRDHQRQLEFELLDKSHKERYGRYNEVVSNGSERKNYEKCDKELLRKNQMRSNGRLHSALGNNDNENLRSETEMNQRCIANHAKPGATMTYGSTKEGMRDGMQIKLEDDKSQKSLTKNITINIYQEKKPEKGIASFPAPPSHYILNHAQRKRVPDSTIRLHFDDQSQSQSQGNIRYCGRNRDVDTSSDLFIEKTPACAVQAFNSGRQRNTRENERVIFNRDVCGRHPPKRDSYSKLSSEALASFAPPLHNLESTEYPPLSSKSNVQPRCITQSDGELSRSPEYSNAHRHDTERSPLYLTEMPSHYQIDRPSTYVVDYERSVPEDLHYAKSFHNNTPGKFSELTSPSMEYARPADLAHSKSPRYYLVSSRNGSELMNDFERSNLDLVDGRRVTFRHPERNFIEKNNPNYQENDKPASYTIILPKQSNGPKMVKIYQENNNSYKANDGRDDVVVLDLNSDPRTRCSNDFNQQSFISNHADGFRNDPHTPFCNFNHSSVPYRQGNSLWRDQGMGLSLKRNSHERRSFQTNHNGRNISKASTYRPNMYYNLSKNFNSLAKDVSRMDNWIRRKGIRPHNHNFRHNQRSNRDHWSDENLYKNSIIKPVFVRHKRRKRSRLGIGEWKRRLKKYEFHRPAKPSISLRNVSQRAETRFSNRNFQTRFPKRYFRKSYRTPCGRSHHRVPRSSIRKYCPQPNHKSTSITPKRVKWVFDQEVVPRYDQKFAPGYDQKCLGNFVQRSDPRYDEKSNQNSCRRADWDEDQETKPKSHEEFNQRGHQRPHLETNQKSNGVYSSRSDWVSNLAKKWVFNQRFNQRSDRKINRRLAQSYDQRSDRCYDGRSDRSYDGRSDRSYDQRSDRSYDRRSDRSYDRRSDYSSNLKYNHRFAQGSSQESFDRADGISDRRSNQSASIQSDWVTDQRCDQKTSRETCQDYDQRSDQSTGQSSPRSADWSSDRSLKRLPDASLPHMSLPKYVMDRSQEELDYESQYASQTEEDSTDCANYSFDTSSFESYQSMQTDITRQSGLLAY